MGIFSKESDNECKWIPFLRGCLIASVCVIVFYAGLCLMLAVPPYIFLEVTAHILLHILKEIPPVKLRFIGVRSFAYKMVHWLHSPPVLLILIHLRSEIPPCVGVYLCGKEKNELLSRGCCVIYCNLLTRWPHFGGWHCDIQYTACVCACGCT